MQTLRRKYLGLLPVIVFTISSAVAQGSQADMSLSPRGVKAFTTLSKTKLFAIGGIGMGGDISEGEKALDILVEEKDAKAVFQRLIANGTLEAGLYGLFGLSMLGCDCFDKEFSYYKNDRLVAIKDSIAVQSGCIKSGADSLEDKRQLVDLFAKSYFDEIAKAKQCRRMNNGRSPDVISKCIYDARKQK